MKHRYWYVRQFCSFALLSALLACGQPLENGGRRFSINLTLADTMNVVAAVDGPFVSVADSVHVDVRTSRGDPAASGGQRLARYATSVTIPLDVQSGSVVFSARVLSGNRTVLYAGEATTDVTADGFSVTVPLTPQTPVLVVMPDTTRSGFVTSSQFTIFNSGRDSLAWNLESSDTAFTRCGTPCQMIPSSGRVGAQGSATVVVRVPANFPSRSFAFTLRSPQGSVVASWLYTASSVVGVTVTPAPTIVLSDASARLSATVQVTGPAATSVTWSSSNPNVVSVFNGDISGNTPGTAVVTATSTADTSKKGASVVRVPGFAPFFWRVVTPGSSAIVSRDTPGIPNTISLVARADSQGITSPFPNGVEFWGQPVTGGPWRLLGQVQQPTITVVGNSRSYSFTLVWNPDPTTAPFTSNTRLNIVATGVVASGVMFGTPINAFVTVVP